MTTEIVTAALLIAVPIAFNLAFFELGRAFDYPNILRKEPDEILRRFAAGGSGLILRWEALLLSALAMLPLVALLAVGLAAPAPLTAASIVVGSAAALVQALGLVRWPFAVPELARRYVAAEGEDAAATRRLHRGDVRDAPPAPRRGHRRASRLPADRRLDPARRGLDHLDDCAARLARAHRHPDRARARW